MRVMWIRGRESIRFNRPHTWFCLGVRGSGKSTFLEDLGRHYLNKDHKILDLFGSRDGEGLAWLRSPYAKDRKILLIHGDNVDVKASFKTKNISKFRLGDLDRYDIIISSSPLYSSPNDEFLHVNHIINLLYRRLSWKRLVYIICREAANLYYSRLRVSANQLAAKAESTYLIREARHMGLALGLDTLKYTSVDIDVRSVLDFLILKAQGVLGFPDDLEWLYSFYEPSVVRNMAPQHFIIVSRGGALGLGEFPKIEWHKQERENILRSVGVKVEYGEEIEYGESKGAFTTVGDEEHARIIEAYCNKTGMHKIAKALNRSTATVHGQISSHDEAIERNGFCARCKRMKTEYRTRKLRQN